MISAPPPRAPAAALLTACAAAGVALSLWLRVAYRGPYCAGWELLGQAQGQFLLSTEPFLRAFWRVLWESRHFPQGYFTAANSVPYALLPGLLGTVLPWPYWGHLLTLALSALMFGLVARLAGLWPRRAWFVLLLWGASPALLSYSVTGYPYITGFLPHVLALGLVWDERPRARPWLSAAAALLVCELSWHLYPLGKTVWCVFLAAACLRTRASLGTRAVWGAAAAAQAVLCLLYRDDTVDGLLASIPRAFSFADLGAALGGLPAAFLGLDSPLFLVLGALSFFFYRKDRRLLGALFLCQAAALLVLALSGLDNVRTYRGLVLSLYLALSLARLFGEWEGRQDRRPARLALVGLLALGGLWQAGSLLRFFGRPASARSHPLPYAESQYDYFVDAAAVRAAQDVVARVRAGGRVLLVYNLSAFPEHPSDPQGVLERVYLALGHRRFVGSVFVFGSRACRYDCLPIRPLEGLDAFLSGADAARLTGLSYGRPEGGEEFAAESARIMERLGRDYVVEFARDDGSMFREFRLRRKTSRERPG